MPPWMSKLSPSAIVSTGRVRAGFNPISCRTSLCERPQAKTDTQGWGIGSDPDRKWSFPQQPGESSPAWSFWSDVNCWQQLSSPQRGWDMGYVRAVLTARCTSPRYSLSLLWQPRPGKLQPCPLRHPALAVSGRKPLQHLQGEGTIPSWPAQGNTGCPWQHMESELHPGWPALLLPWCRCLVLVLLTYSFCWLQL